MARRYAALPVDPTDTDPAWAGLTCAEQSLYVTLVRDSTMTQAGELGVTLRAWSLQSADRTPETVERDLRNLDDRGYVVVDWNRERLLVRGHIANDSSLGNPKHAGGCLASIGKVKSPLLRAAIVEDMERVEDDRIAPSQVKPFRDLQAVLAAAAIANPIANANGNRSATAQPVTCNPEPATCNPKPETSLRGADEPAPVVVETVPVSASVQHLDPFTGEVLDVDLFGTVNDKSAEDQGEATVGSLTGTYVTLYKDTHGGKRPSPDFIARTGKAIKQALDGGTATGPDIEAALRAQSLKPKCGPATLPGFIAEVTSTVAAVTPIDYKAAARQAQREREQAEQAASVAQLNAHLAGTAGIPSTPAMKELPR